MSLCVAVVSRSGAALATDTLQVELAGPAPVVSAGFVKHVMVGDRAAGIVGVSNFDEHLTTDWVATALTASASLEDLPRCLLEAGGPDWVHAFLRWRERVGTDAVAEEFFTMVVVSTVGGLTEGAVIWADLVDDAFTFRAQRHTAGNHALVLAAGAVDHRLLAYTDDGRLLRHAALLQGTPTPLVDVPLLSADLTSTACETVARDLVTAAIARENAMERPGWWPAGVPVLASPVTSARV